MYISQEALNHFDNNAFQYADPFTPANKLHVHEQPLQIKHKCKGVTHPVTDKIITKNKVLIKDNNLKPILEEGMCVKLGQLAQGYKNTLDTNTIKFMDKNMVRSIPKDRTVTYVRIVVDYHPQKDKSDIVYITTGRKILNIQTNSQHTLLIWVQQKCNETM